LIPAVLYGEEVLNLQLHKNDLLKILHTEAGENVIVNLKISRDGKPKERTVIIKEIQYDPLRGEMLHVDFYQISLTKVLTVNVPVVAHGEPIGVRQERGTLEHILWEVQVECLPTQIPKGIEADTSNLKIGESIFVKDLVAPPGAKILNDPGLIVFSVKPPVVEEKVEKIKPEEEKLEPEVIKQKKKEEEAPSEKEKEKK
jgi:large subunit ribosomal protein L25